MSTFPFNEWTWSKLSFPLILNNFSLSIFRLLASTTQIFKVVYVPSQRLAFAIVADNTTVDRYDIRPVRELSAQAGIAFPGIPADVAAKTNVAFNGHAFTVRKWGW